MTNELAPGDVRVGHISDGIDEGPVQSGTLTFDEEGGAQLLVAYLRDELGDEAPQFARTSTWFRFTDDSKPPATLLFFDSRGIVTLVDNRLGGAALGSYPLGRIRPQVLIFQRPRTFKEEYRVRDFKSTIDGLEAFAGFRPISFDTVSSEGGYRTTIAIEPSELIEWEACGFHYVIRANVAWTGQEGRSFELVDSQPYVQTTNEAGATPHDHLAAQWSVRALLTLIYGTKLAWRSHQLRDDEFPMWMLSGDAHDPHFVDVHLAGTVKQHRWPKPETASLRSPSVRLADLGSGGMRKWVELYADEVFERAVQPAVEVINGATSFLEPQLMMLAISLDRFGHFRHGDGRRRAMWENIEKCLIDAQLDWPEIGSRRGIAMAISNINNDLKHPDRERYPETTELAGAVYLSKIIVRAQLFDLLGLPDTLRQGFLRSNDARNAVDVFVRHGLRVDDEGTRVAVGPVGLDS
ncbi:ApeA N-terminal domain 1-containing protein [Microbacterium aurum]